MSCLGPSLPQGIGSCQYRRVSIPLTAASPAGTAACCAPLTAQPLSPEQAGQAVQDLNLMLGLDETAGLL